MPVMHEVSNTEVWGEYVGHCKWFNKNFGYGFVTVTGKNGMKGGDQFGKDVFVHHSGVKPANSNFRTLKKGEYINFNIIEVDKGLQAVDVTGIFGGPLQCDNIMPPTRYNNGRKVPSDDCDECECGMDTEMAA
jgi:cold shock CspA family protein